MAQPNDVNFLYELGSLRHLQRTWRQFFGNDVQNDLEHTIRVAFLSLILARRQGSGNEEKILKMALIHDVAESRTGDTNFFMKRYTTLDEENALRDSLAGTHLEDFTDVLQEYRKRECIEARLVKDADHLDVDLEMKELEEQGHQLPQHWNEDRRKIRDTKFHTDVGKAFWDEIQSSRPSAWHTPDTA